MRAVDMTVGEKYVTNRGRVVTYLATPDDVRSQRRVRVRFEDGISRGNERDLPTRSIARPRTPSPSRPAPRRIKPQPSSTIVELARPPRVGDTVIIGHVTGELRWIVDAIDAERGVATISAKIFGQPQTRSALIDALDG